MRNLDGVGLADAFLLAAVVTVLAIRGFLAATGYPQVGGSRLHIAHMLWGGLGMLVALLVLLLFVGRRVRTAAAWIGGVGFGAFIDELGKFLTSDNDYFFRPAVALIYATFTAAFLLVRYVSQRRPPSPAERLSYAYGALTDLAAGRLGDRERRRALALLEGDDEPVPEVRALLRSAPAPTRPPSRWTRLTRWVNGLVDRVRAAATSPAVRRAVLALFFALAAGMVAATILAVVQRSGLPPSLDALTVGAGLTVAGIVLGTGLGVAQLARGARATALRLFRVAGFVALLVGQFVAFVAFQFVALASLAVNLLVLAALRAELTAETDRAE